MGGLLPNADAAVGALGICFGELLLRKPAQQHTNRASHVLRTVPPLTNGAGGAMPPLSRLPAGTRALSYLAVTGLASAATIRVSNQLGAHQPSGAARSMVAALVVGMGLCVFGLALPLWFARHAWVALFTHNAGVRDLVLACFPALMVSLLGDAADGLLGGAVKGAGRQQLAATVTLGSYWACGLPLSAVLALHYGRGAVGLIEGITIASLGQGLVLGAAVLRLDWGAEACAAQRRVSSTVHA
jgi:MATE family multidrug resistance protein